jgi:ribosome-binding ATPase YchF (GTP1/OBG family)
MLSRNVDLVRSGRVAVPDDRLDFLAEHFKPPSKVPAFLSVIDIAGLVRGASKVAELEELYCLA